MNENEKELELNFFEAGMGLIISNLELLAELVQVDEIADQQLDSIINEFINVESLTAFQQVTNKLQDWAQELMGKLEKTEVTNRFEILAHLYLAMNWATTIAPQSEFSTTILNQAERLNLTTELDVILEAKKIAVGMVQTNLKTIEKNYGTKLTFSEQFKKLLTVSLEFDNLEDLKEGNAFLTEIFQFEQTETTDFLIKTEVYRLLMANESLIILLDFWQDSLSDLNLKKLH